MDHHQTGPRLAAFALCPTGTGKLLRRDAQQRGMHVAGVTNDGRADVVFVSPRSWNELVALRGAETICADLGAVRLLPSLGATVAQVTQARLSTAMADLRRRGLLPNIAKLRLVVRLRNEHGFSRTALRQAAANQLRAQVTRGHEPANELWLLQDTRHSLRLGLRVPSLEPRRPARRVERPGSLRPAVAATMVMLAGPNRGRMLDPCCGSGSLLAEASLIGWRTVGGDNSDGAIAAAAVNATAPVCRLDSRQLPFRDNEFDALVTNLPFGHQYKIQGAPVAWYRRTLSEAIRIAPRVVVLSPASTPFRQALGRMKVTLVERHDIEVLGRPSSIWVIGRSTEP
jgi:predicted RNA methylase